MQKPFFINCAHRCLFFVCLQTNIVQEKTFFLITSRTYKCVSKPFRFGSSFYELHGSDLNCSVTSEVMTNYSADGCEAQHKNLHAASECVKLELFKCSFDGKDSVSKKLWMSLCHVFTKKGR